MLPDEFLPVRKAAPRMRGQSKVSACIEYPNLG